MIATKERPRIIHRRCPSNDHVVTWSDEVLRMHDEGRLQRTILGEVYQVNIWRPGDPVLVSEKLALDTETHKIVKGDTVYPVICQVCDPISKVIQIAAWPHFYDYVDELFSTNPDTTWYMHNAPFDIRVCGLDKTPWLVRAVNEGNLVDTGLRFILDSLSRGTYYGVWGLDFMINWLFKYKMPKDDAIRLGYKQDMEITLPFLNYAADDPAWTMAAMKRLPQKACPTEAIQVRGALALNDISNNGFLVDKSRMNDLRVHHNEVMESCRETLENWGYRSGEKGNNKLLQHTMQQFEHMYTIRFERTEKSGAIKTDKDMLVHFPTGMKVPKFVTSLQAYKHSEKMVSTYLNEAMLGVDSAVHPYFEPLVKTARTSCRGPNIQNLPRKGGLREMYVARPGHVLYACDLDQAELCALAQSCWTRFGTSKLRELINSGEDVHFWLGERIATAEGKDWSKLDDAEKKFFRQYAKVANFGFPGGLGAKTLQKSARGYGLELTIAQCQTLRVLWREAFPEMEMHLKPTPDPNNPTMYIASTITKRVRRNATFCSACNYEFQGLVADAAKIALWLIYTAGFKMVNFIHDEVIVELPIDDNLQASCKKIDELMCQGMVQVIPDVRVGAEGALMHRWYKEAGPIRAGALTGNPKEGDLLIWTPELAAKVKALKEESEKEEKFDFDVDALEEKIGSVTAA